MLRDDQALMPADDSSEEVRKRSRVTEEGREMVDVAEDADPLLGSRSQQSAVTDTTAVGLEQARKLSVFDVFRHKHLRFNTVIIWIAWCVQEHLRWC